MSSEQTHALSVLMSWTYRGSESNYFYANRKTYYFRCLFLGLKFHCDMFEVWFLKSRSRCPLQYQTVQEDWLIVKSSLLYLTMKP